MVSFTPEFAGNTMVFMIIGYILALIFQVYMLYLNWKQSRVKNDSQKMIDILGDIKEYLKSIDKSTDIIIDQNNTLIKKSKKGV